MTSTYLRGTLVSVASLLAATIYQGNPYMNHQLWNIGNKRYYRYHYVSFIPVAHISKLTVRVG
jgi:hypothetical protein